MVYLCRCLIFLCALLFKAHNLHYCSNLPPTKNSTPHYSTPKNLAKVIQPVSHILHILLKYLLPTPPYPQNISKLLVANLHSDEGFPGISALFPDTDLQGQFVSLKNITMTICLSVFSFRSFSTYQFQDCCFGERGKKRKSFIRLTHTDTKST